MISVCMTTYNGAPYIRSQLESILVSPLVSEVLVSDDGSSDCTVEIVNSFDDERIRLIQGPGTGLIDNFESLLVVASGEYIFLSDQDDVWLPNKVEVMLASLRDADLVVCDCSVVDTQLNVLHSSFFALRDSRPGLVRNLIRNRYLGCCIAMRRQVLRYALPFPRHLPMHDWWLGLVAETFCRVSFVDQPLMMYRRHGGNVSSTAERSCATWATRIFWRLNLLIALISRVLKVKNKLDS